MSKFIYHPFIDALRAIAVIAVIIYHLNPSWLPGGFAGVDIFFVISGFIVSASIGNFQGRNVLSFLAFFYSRRIKRIFPALIVCLLATTYFSALFIPDAWLSGANQKTGLFAFFGLSNFILSQNGNSYFDPKADFNPFLQTWSLGVEEQFYLIFPLIFFLWLCGKKAKFCSVALVCIGLLASVAYTYLEMQNSSINVFFSSFGRFWELASGILLYQMMTLLRPEPPGHLFKNKIYNFIAIVSLFFLFLSFMISMPAAFPMPGAIFPVMASVFILFSLYQRQCPLLLSHLLENQYVLFCGRISYSLYLWHWPIFTLFRWTYGLKDISTISLALFLTVVVSVLSYFFIETPVRRSHFIKNVPNFIIVPTDIFLIVLSFYGASFINKQTDKISLSTVMKEADFWYPYNIPRTSKSFGKSANIEDFFQNGAEVRIFKSPTLRRTKSNYHVLHVIGDSHTHAYRGLFEQFALQNNLEIDTYPNAGCSFLGFKNISSDCRASQQNSLKVLAARVKSGDVIFLPSLRIPRYCDEFGAVLNRSSIEDFTDSASKKMREKEVDLAINMFRPFTEKKIQIVFEGPKPLFYSPPFRCSDSFNKSNPDCRKGMDISREILAEYRKPTLDSYQKIIASLPYVSVYDPFPILCPEAVCHAYQNGHSMFFDGDHISAFGNNLLLPSFSDYFLPKLSGNSFLKREN